MNLERSLWHPVALGHVVGSQPRAVTLLGEDLVLWRDGNGHAHAWMDQCPTAARACRSACMAASWNTSRLAFDGGGRCPCAAVPDFQPGAPRRTPSTPRPTACCGCVWLRPRASRSPPHCPCSPPAEPRLRKTTSGPTGAASAPRIVRTSSTWRTSLCTRLAGQPRAAHPPTRCRPRRTARATGCLAWQPRSRSTPQAAPAATPMKSPRPTWRC